MLRFIFNFFLFGILFYLIYLFFPDVFQTLVSWANHVYEFLKDVVMQISGKIQTMRSSSDSQPLPPQHALLLVPLWLASKSKR